MDAELLDWLTKDTTHYECEDCWYSCPKSGECCDDRAGDDCTCGADQENAIKVKLRALLLPQAGRDG